MHNNITFTGEFHISKAVRDKYLYRQTMKKRLEQSLITGFYTKTKNNPYYNLELSEINTSTKGGLFSLKYKDKTLASRYEYFWGASGKMTVENLINIYNKLLITKTTK